MKFKNFMPFIITFIASVVLAIISAFVVLSATMPPGEGSFGIAKLAPLILIILVSVFFCLIWFPANLIVWLLLRRKHKGTVNWTKEAFIFSGMLFAIAFALCAYRLTPQLLYRVHFYYKLEDQFGQPIPGVDVLRYNNFTTTAEDKEMKSDAQGLFQEICKPDESFTLALRKEGYVVMSSNLAGAYSDEIRKKKKKAPGLNNRIVIKMWKLQGSEPLVSFNQTYKIHYTAKPVNFDFITGKIVSNGGDVRITVNRPNGEVSEHNPQKWGIEFEVVDGGFIETSGKESSITFAAPEGDYQAGGAFGNNNGTDGLDKNFFIESRNGQVFSKLYLSVGINNKPDGLMYVTFRGVANTNRSRNWEATAPK